MAQQQALILSINSIAARVGALEAERALASLGRAAKGAASDVDGMESKLRSAGDSMKRVGRALTIGVTAPLVGLAGFAVKAAADMDSLKRSLDAMTGSSAETAVQMERLKQVARAPGLGFREAVQGSVNLQAVGFAATDAERAIMAFGNAIATTGGGKAELDRVLFQLTQMAATGRIVAQDLRPIIQTAPAVAKALNELFGTTSAEAISSQVDSFEEFFGLLIPKLESMPSVAGGAANSLENLGDAAFRARAALGDQLLPVVLPLVEGLANLLEQSADLNPEMLRTGIAFGAAAAVVGPLTLGVAGLATAVGTLVIAGAPLWPLLAVGGLITVGLSTLVGLFVKSKLEALAAAAAVDDFKRALTGMDLATAIGTERTLQARIEAVESAGASIAAMQGEQDTLGNSDPARLNELKEGIARLRSFINGNPPLEKLKEDLESTKGAVRTLGTTLTNNATRGLEVVDEKAEQFRRTLKKLREEAEKISLALSNSMFDASWQRDVSWRFNPNQLANGRHREAWQSVRKGVVDARAAGGIVTTPGYTPPPAKAMSKLERQLLALEIAAKNTGDALLRSVANGAKAVGAKLLDLFNPLTIATTMLDEAFRSAVPEMKALMEPVRKIAHAIGQALAPVLEALAPVFEKLAPIISAVAQVLGALMAALAPIFEATIPLLRALFPVFKALAIAATYVGQVFGIVAGVIMHVVGWLVSAIGVAIEAIGRVITKIPGLGDFGMIDAGEAMQDWGAALREGGDEMFKMWDTMAEAREAIKGIHLEGSLEDLGDAASKATSQLLNYANVPHVNALRFRVSGGAVGGGMAMPPSGPLDTNPSTPAGGSITINVHGTTDPERVAEEVVRRLERQEQRGAPSRLRVALA